MGRAWIAPHYPELSAHARSVGFWPGHNLHLMLATVIVVTVAVGLAALWLLTASN